MTMMPFKGLDYTLLGMSYSRLAPIMNAHGFSYTADSSHPPSSSDTSKDIQDALASHLHARLKRNYSDFQMVVSRALSAASLSDTKLAILKLMRALALWDAGYPWSARDYLEAVGRLVDGGKQEKSPTEAYMQQIVPIFLAELSHAPICVQRTLLNGEAHSKSETTRLGAGEKVTRFARLEVPKAMSVYPHAKLAKQSVGAYDHKRKYVKRNRTGTQGIEIASKQHPRSPATMRKSRGTRCERHTRQKQKCDGPTCKHFGFGPYGLGYP